MIDRSTREELDQSPAIESDKLREHIVTVVLTADNHLGYAAFGQHPHKREERRQRLRHAFQQATDFAAGQGVDLFIQAGDLFDSSIPDEQDRSFVAARLANLQQAGIRTFALGGVHDTPVDTSPLAGAEAPAPQMSYARLGALHYFAPNVQEFEPVLLDVHGVSLAIYGLSILAGHEGDPLERMHVQNDIERAAIRLLVLHAPIEGLATGSTLLETRTRVSRASIANQPYFRYILGGYHHGYSHLHFEHCDLIVAGATQHIDFSDPDDDPGFVFLGLAADGVRWCKHIAVDALLLKRLVIDTSELWSEGTDAARENPTDIILERLHPLCSANTIVQVRLQGELSRVHYHQLDLNQIRRYGEDHCFSLDIDDSTLAILPEHDAVSAETGERFSPREELIALADEWIAAAPDEKEKKALRATKEELLMALSETRIL